MQEITSQRGSTSVIAIILVLVLIGGGIFFFVSKPFQTSVKDAYEVATEWTPENIQKDPVGYLSWALRHTDATKQKLEASILSLKTKRNAAARALEKNTADKGQYEKLFEELKQAYTAAAGQFPVVVRGNSLEEGKLKSSIVEANDTIRNHEILVQTYTKTGTIIERKLGEIQNQMTELERLRNKLSTDLEIAKVNKTVEGIGSIGDQLLAITDTANALASTAEEGTSLQDMITPTGTARVDEEFAKLMAK